MDKKQILINLLKESGMPVSKLNTLSMTWEKVDVEKIADYLLAHDVDIVPKEPCEECIHFGTACVKYFINKNNDCEFFRNKTLFIKTKGKVKKKYVYGKRK